MSITASNSSGKLNLSMSNCHKLFSFCYRKVWKIIDIRKTFSPFLVARSLKGLCAFYLSFYILFYFFGNLQRGRRREIGCSILSVCLKRKDWKVYTRFYDIIIFFFGLLVFSFTIYIFRYLTNERNILRIKPVLRE